MDNTNKSFLILKETDLESDDGIQFKLFHNLEDHELDAALLNWSARTNEPSAKSLCDYINSKRLKGLSNHYAFTEEEFNQFKNKRKVETN